MGNTYIGIDPGLTGALAFLEGDNYQVWDAPVGDDGRRRKLMPRIMVDLVRTAGVGNVFVERVHSMPRQGVASSFNFGYGFGLWVGIVIALGYPITQVIPQEWKRVMMAGMPKGKDASRIRAQELFPDAELHLKKHHGRADALLIAEYGRRAS